WYYAIPSSSSHALIGGLVGAGVAKAGTWALIPAGILKTVAFIFISPLLGFLIGSLLFLTISWLFVKSTPSRVDRIFRRLQLSSSPLVSASRCRQRTPSPARLSESGLRNRSPRCAGDWPATSCGRGSSPFPARRSSPACRGGSPTSRCVDSVSVLGRVRQPA